MSTPSYIITDSAISIAFDNGAHATIFSNDTRWDSMVSAIQAQDWEKAYQTAFPVENVKESIKNTVTSNVAVEDGVVYYDGSPLHGTLTDRMLQMFNQGFDITPLANFLDNLMDNPSYRAVNELYDFLEASNLPITADGHLIAYKRVRSDYTDLFSGEFDNSVGAVCEMTRNMVDEDKNRTCSHGLHFCGREYLSFYGTQAGNRTMVVKINPADVVAIPSDHNNMKGRTCRYEVVDELTHSDEKELETKPVWWDERTNIIDTLLDEMEDEIDDVFDDLDDLDDDFDDTDSDESSDGVVNLVDSVQKKFPNAVVQLGSTMPEASSVSVKWVYTSPGDAAKRTGISNIPKVLSNERHTAGGYRWMYASEWLRRSRSHLR